MPTNSEPFVMIPMHVLDSGVSSKTLHVYMSIRRHADNVTGETWVGRELIAEHSGMSRVKSVDPHIKELVEAGLIVSTPRYVNGRDKRDWSFVRDAQHPERGSNLYTITDIAAGREGGAKTPYPRARERPGVGRENAHELDPLNQTHVTTYSVIASSDRAKGISVDASATPNPEPLNIWWSPNPTHMKSAEKLGVDIEDTSRRFRRWANLEGFKPENRRNWNSTFGDFIKKFADIDEYGERRSDLKYPGSGDDYEDRDADVLTFPSERVRGVA